MFLRYYGFHEQPFGTTPDPRFLYLGASHREALASLIYGIETGRGFLSLIAEPGMGKTTVLFQLMDRLRNSARTVFLFQTQVNARELLCNLIADLGLDPGDRDVGSLQRQLNEVLIQEAQMGRQFVLIIDESQNLDDSVLESVRMLSNFETPRSKLMQIILAGQPGLADKLARPQLEQLKQRISIMCRLKPFTKSEVGDYVGHRLEMVGYKGRDLFTPEALTIIAEQSEGIPRNVNNLCFHALSLAYAKGQKKINRSILEEVLNDLKLDPLKNSRINPVPKDTNEEHAPVRSLEDIALGGGARGEEDKKFVRPGRGYPSPSRRLTVAGGRRHVDEKSPWLFRAVALLTLLLAGELFWAYLPSGTSGHEVKKLAVQTLGQAKGAAVKDKLLKGNTSSTPSSANPTVIHVNDNHGGQSQGDSKKGSTESGNRSSEPQGATSSIGQKAPDTARVINPLAESPITPSTPTESSLEPSESSSAENSRPSAQVAKGKIVVESNVAGSAITINGKTDPTWQTPHVFSLPRGTYGVSVSQNGYSTWFKNVRVTAGNKKWVNAVLRPPRGVIVIDTEPPGMQVFIDGKPYGPSEVEAALTVGSHTYKVIPPGGQKPVKGSFVLKAGAILTRKIRWLPATGQPSAENMPDSAQPQSGSNPPKGREQS